MNILVLDVGTSGMKAIIFDQHGGIQVKKSKQYYPEYYREFVELDAEIVKKCLWDLLEEISCWTIKYSVSLGSVAVTAQRSSIIPVDPEGNPLQKAIMWQDKRAEAICAEYKDMEKEIYQICGMKPSPVFSAAKILWLKRNLPDIFHNAYKIIGFHEFIIHSITGKFLTDTSIAGRSGLMDIRQLSWSQTLTELFEVDADKLCQIYPAGSICGYTNNRFMELFEIEWNLPVVTAGGDQQCAAIGLGCILPGDLAVNAGTGAFVTAITDKPVLDNEMRTVCNPSSIPGRWIVEGSVLSCGSAINWLNELLFYQEGQSYPYENFNRAATSAQPGANGLVIIPSFCGKGTPCWDSHATAQISNLTLNHRKEDFARALLEGIAVEITSCADTVANVCGLDEMNRINSGGGLSQNLLYNQILAAISSKDIIVSDCNEVTALGAWIMAAVANGIFTGYENAYREAMTKMNFQIITAK